MHASRSLRCLSLALCATWLVACGGSSPAAAPPGDIGLDVVTDAAPDASGDVASETEAGIDVVADVPEADVSTDALDADVLPGRCRDDQDCAANEFGHLCETASARCVPCTPSNRGSCMATEYCTAAFRCEAGCGADTDCAATPATARCNADRHRCAACVTDAHCPTAANAAGHCADDRCGFTCATGFADCDGDASNGCEVDTRASALHCNGCGMRCPSAPNSSPSCAAGHCGIACDMGFADCDGDASNGCEVDTRTSAANCGACGRACAGGSNALAACEAGTCRLACTSGYADCDGLASNGCEAALSGTANCGMCGSMCSGAAPLCTASDRGSYGCGSGCSAGQTRCASSCVDTATSVEHCGMCGNACARRANAQPACSGGACGITCEAGFGDCDMSAANGCETTVSSDVRHCGMCGNACATGPHASPSCEGGRCGLRCDAGFEDCDGDPSNGCEADLQTSSASCGRCGNACPAGASSTAACAAGRCGLRCADGRGDCDGNPSNGCEVDLAATTVNCGRCGNACAAGANASPTCAAGVCGATCATGYADCDGLATTGCEASLHGTANCGACGNACGASAPLCSDVGASTMCVTGCATAEVRCGGSCVSTATSLDHCGMCGNACPSALNASRTCAGGACGFTCGDGFADCDHSATTGCEVDTRSSVTNCGACGNACTAPASSAPTCTAGSCGFTCNATFADCDHVAANGCEANTQTDARNCGSCGTACTAGRCDAGRCVSNRTCAEILSAAPGSMSGNYTIDPDGAGGRSPYTVYCDMTTDGGGWTLVFQPTTSNYADPALDYTIQDAELLRISTSTLMAYRNATQVALSNWARFDLPTAWRTQSPFRYAGNDESVLVVVGGAAPVRATLRYGYLTYSTLCSDPWVSSGNWGRLCIIGTTAPFYSGHAVAPQDTCSNSNQVWNTANCSDSLRFTLAVR